MASQFRRSLFGLVDKAAQAHPSSVAVRSPFQPGPLETLTYKDLRSTSLKLAKRLASVVSNASVQQVPHAGIISDLSNTVENLVLQIACSRLGLAYCTVKDETMLKSFEENLGPKLVEYKHFVVTESSSWAAGFSGMSLVKDLFDNLENEQEFVSSSLDSDMSLVSDVNQVPHAFFNTASKPLVNHELLTLGDNATSTLQLTEKDKILVSITLCHPFGIGSAVSAAFTAGATVVLPAVNGIRGCGDPKERAEACKKVLMEEKCTIFFSDAPIVKQLTSLLHESGNTDSDSENFPNLRGGVVKTGSGSDFLDEKVNFGGVQMWTMGKK